MAEEFDPETYLDSKLEPAQAAVSVGTAAPLGPPPGAPPDGGAGEDREERKSSRRSRSRSRSRSRERRRSRSRDRGSRRGDLLRAVPCARKAASSSKENFITLTAWLQLWQDLRVHTEVRVIAQHARRSLVSGCSRPPAVCPPLTRHSRCVKPSLRSCGVAW